MRFSRGRWKGVAAALAAALLASGCAARWAYRQGQKEAKKGNWDLAVARLTRALEKDPDNIPYKIALENARIQASRHHYKIARKHMAADELEQARDELEIAAKYDPSDRSAADDLAIVRAKIARREEEKSRMADFEAMKGRAITRVPLPVLSPRSQSPITLRFPDQSLQKVFETLGKVAGVNVLFDDGFRDKRTDVNLTGVTFQEALDQLALTNHLFYKVLDQNTVIIVPESAQKRRQYEELMLRTFYLQNAEVKEVEAIVKNIVGIQKVVSNATLGAITVMATPDQLALAERIVEANDKARGEVMVDVEILEVNRTLIKQYGIQLSNYEASVTLAPTGASGEVGGGFTNVRAQILSSLNLSDYVVSIPSTLLARFLQNDSTVRILASPKLRAAEGKSTELKIGTEVPIPVTTFTATQAGTSTFAPATTFNYRNVGVNLKLTPRVSPSGDITLEVVAEFSLLGDDRNVGTGQNPIIVPTFLTRNVNGIVRLKDGETSLIGGLVQGRTAATLGGALGVESIPIIGKLFQSTQKRIEDTEILISMTPHLVRVPKLTEQDLGSLFTGTQEVIRVPGARPPLFGTPESAAPPNGTQPPPPNGTGGAVAPGVVPMPPAAGSAPVNGRARPSPSPSPVTPPPGGPSTPGGVTIPPGTAGVPEAPVPEATPTAPGQTPALPTPTPPPGGTAGSAVGGPAVTGPSASTAVLSPPETSVKVGETGSVSVVIMGAREVTAVEMVLAYDASLVEALDVVPGSLLTLDGARVVTQRNLEPGRVTASLTRPTGVSGSGVVASLTLRATQPGTASLALASIVLRTSSGTDQPAVPAPARVVVTP
jgi:general secretion pathway protein D